MERKRRVFCTDFQASVVLESMKEQYPFHRGRLDKQTNNGKPIEALFCEGVSKPKFLGRIRVEFSPM